MCSEFISLFLANQLVFMDEEEFESNSFQRVYQYIRRYTAGENLDNFSFKESSVEGTPQECLQQIVE